MAVLKPAARVIPPLLHSISVTVHPTPAETHTCGYSGDCLPVSLPACLPVSVFADWLWKKPFSMLNVKVSRAVLVITLRSRRSEKSSPQMASARQREALAGEKKKERQTERKKGHKQTNTHLFSAPVN